MKKKQDQISNVMLPEEYWEWRNCCTELFNANLKEKIAELESQLLKKDIDIATSKAKLHFATNVRASRDSVLNVSENYRKMKDRIESRLGISLNNKIIDDVTFEVKEAPND